MSDPRLAPAIRLATEADLPRIVELIHLGAVAGKGGEDLGPPLPEAYYAAFRSFGRFPEAKVLVAELDGAVVGTFQFHLLPSLRTRHCRPPKWKVCTLLKLFAEGGSARR